MSGAIASMFSAVSTSVSPFSTLEVATAMFKRVGAEALLGDLERGPGPRARLEEQVDDVLPRSVGTFLIGRWPISRIASAVSRIR